MRSFFSVLLAAVALFAEASGTQAENAPSNLGEAGILQPNTSCPAATHLLIKCPPRDPNVYLVFERQKGKVNNLEGGFVEVVGVADLETCWPVRLIRVREIQGIGKTTCEVQP